jgi:restriction endonuclease S subunit
MVGMKLSDLFHISTGYTFRDAIQTFGSGSVGVVQAGDVNEVRLPAIVRIHFAGERHLLKAGDIVIGARGRSIACIITPDILPAVAASSVLVLRPSSPAVNSAFVAHYLNSRPGQAALARLVSGAYIKTLRIAELTTLEVPLPSAETQARLVKLAENMELQTELNRKKQTLYDEIWNTTVTTVTKGPTT